MTKHRLSYWEQRQVQNMYHYMEKAEDAADQIAKLYQKASGYISHQADAIFDKYQTKHRLTEAEAYRLINQLQDKASLDELLQKLRNGEDHRKELLAKLEAPAYQARLERLKQLQNQIDQIMTEVYDQEKQKNRSHYVDLGNEAYYRGIFDLQQQAEAAFGFSYLSARQIEAAINRKWSGKNYSERIWKNTRLLAQELKQELLINLVTGRTNREVAEIIQNKFGKGASKARRLVRTESNYLATELNFKAYEECGVEKYQYLATLDLRTSEICRGLDGKLFLVKDRKAGVNCPPMHPWCRSTTISVADESLIAKMQRSAIDPATGKRIKVPRSMTYKQWYDKYVRGKPEVELEEKKLKNRTADRSQHQKYRKVLADEVPENLDKFQEMKYNNSVRWTELKGAYRDVNWQRKALKNHAFGTERAAPFNGPPNSVYDKYKDGQLVQRRYYGRTGKPRLDIDVSDHGNAKRHPVVPHKHGWQEFEDGSIKRSDAHDVSLKLGDRIANKDILRGGNNND